MRSLLLLLIVITFLTQSTSAQQRSGRMPRHAGAFDYYVLSLSWSPLYCSEPRNAERDPQQCGVGRRYAFVTHGLWPNNSRPPHPRDCGGPAFVPSVLIDQMLPTMPSPALIRHEWRAHGTCSGLDVSDYFAKVRAAYALVKIPTRYRELSTDLQVPAETLRADFRRANPHIPGDAMAFDCRSRYLRELRICLTRDLKPTPCSSSVRDSCGIGTVTMLRVR